MKALTHKLLRELVRLRGQVATIALVMASALGGFTGSLATRDALAAARDDFYARAHFGDLFAQARRVPDAIAARVAAIDGVVAVATTVERDAILDLPGVAEPLTGRLIGVDPRGQPVLDRVQVVDGRWLDPARSDEAVVSERFALVRGLRPGDTVVAVLEGRRTTLRIAGLGVSPAYVYATAGGALPDDRQFGVLWVSRARIAAAFDMEGAFDHVSLQLAPGSVPAHVAAAVDRLLQPWGGVPAYGREEQLSHRILTQEMQEWNVIGTIVPSIFLAVAAFLLHVVLARQVAIQREQIATLKALGYGNAALLRHYAGYVAAIVALGSVLGLALGAWMAHALTGLYAEYFRFPRYDVVLPLAPAVGGIALLGGAALSAAALAVVRAVRVPPAAAMHPPAPTRFRPLPFERGARRLPLAPATRMVLRQLARRPWRFALGAAGVASAVAIVVCGLFWRDALAYIIEVQFETAQRADIEVALAEPVREEARRELARLPGVLEAEAGRAVAVRLVAGARSERVALQGMDAAARLRRTLDADGHPIPPPRDGLVLTDRLALRLGVAPGARVRVEPLEGERRARDVVVAAVSQDFVGLFAGMERHALARLLREDVRVNAISLRVATDAEGAVNAALRDRPGVATALGRRAMLAAFRETSARNILVFTGILTAFAAIIAFGVVYNGARIALGERAWELASLRVLGFTRGEVSALLFGELALEVLCALPFGWLGGHALSAAIVGMTHSDLVQIPLVIAPRSYAAAALVVVAAAAASAFVVRQRIDRLDLVAVLKTRE